MDNLDSTVNKLIILYIFDAIEMPLAEDSIVDICYYDLKCMQYIDCKEAIANLLDAGLIVDAGGAGKATYNITRDGYECLKHFYTRIPSHYRDQIMTYCKENRLNLRKKQEYFSDYFKNDDGSYTVLLRILDKNLVIMELKFIVASRNNANGLSKTGATKRRRSTASCTNHLWKTRRTYMPIYRTKGTCSREIIFSVDNNILTDLKFIGGCSGNLQGIQRLCIGKPIDEIIATLSGIKCRNDTSCPDQLAKALTEYKTK